MFLVGRMFPGSDKRPEAILIAQVLCGIAPRLESLRKLTSPPHSIPLLFLSPAQRNTLPRLVVPLFHLAFLGHDILHDFTQYHPCHHTHIRPLGHLPLALSATSSYVHHLPITWRVRSIGFEEQGPRKNPRDQRRARADAYDPSRVSVAEALKV